MAHLLWLEATAAQRGVARVAVAGLDFGILWDFLKSLCRVEFFFFLYTMVQYGISGFCCGFLMINKKFIALLRGQFVSQHVALFKAKGGGGSQMVLSASASLIHFSTPLFLCLLFCFLFMFARSAFGRIMNHLGGYCFVAMHAALHC